MGTNVLLREDFPTLFSRSVFLLVSVFYFHFFAFRVIHSFLTHAFHIMLHVNFVAMICITVDFGRHNRACKTLLSTKFQGKKTFVIKEYF